MGVAKPTHSPGRMGRPGRPFFPATLPPPRHAPCRRRAGDGEATRPSDLPPDRRGTARGAEHPRPPAAPRRPASLGRPGAGSAGEPLRMGVRFERVLTDNGACYRSRGFPASCVVLVSVTCARDPIRPAPMAKPNAWSRPACAKGPTPALMPTPNSAPAPLRLGCTTATGIVRMPALATNLPSPASH